MWLNKITMDPKCGLGFCCRHIVGSFFNHYKSLHFGAHCELKQPPLDDSLCIMLWLGPHSSSLSLSMSPLRRPDSEDSGSSQTVNGGSTGELLDAPASQEAPGDKLQEHMNISCSFMHNHNICYQNIPPFDIY